MLDTVDIGVQACSKETNKEDHGNHGKAAKRKELHSWNCRQQVRV
jgi:hypothetical protein